MVVIRMAGKSDLHILYLDSNGADVENACRILLESGVRCTPTHASSRADFLTALENTLFDAVLSDDRVPGLTGLEALAIVRERYPELPFIFVTGLPNEEVAVEAMRNGATDYISKQKLPRLVPVLERALKRAQARQDLPELFERAPFGIAWFTPDGVISRINHAGLILLSKGRDAVLGKHLSTLFSEIGTGQDILQRIQSQEPVANLEAWLQRPDGSTRRVLIDCTPFCQNRQVVNACCWIRDAAEPGQGGKTADAAETGVRQVQTMEAIGRFAGGVAHEFSNILTEILGYSRLVLDALGGNSPVRDDAERIIRAAEKASRITKQMMTLAPQKSIQAVPIELNAAILNMDKLLRRVLGEKIQLVTELSNDLKHPLMDASWPDEVVMNLVLNARDNMPDGGTLTLETSNVALDTEFCRKHPGLSPGIHVLLSARDTGPGTDPSVLEHIFEPFYRTREGDQSSGIGLSTLYGIVQQCSGHIEARSPRGAGTEIRLYLPIAQQSASAADAAKPVSLRGTERLLLVEDEEAILRLAARQLRSLGYTVFEARNGKHALMLCAEYKYGFDLVVSDVVMPEMDGFELVRQLRNTNPMLRALFISGFPVSRTQFVPDGKRDDLLKKPFTNNQLALKLRQFLDAGEGRA